MGRRYIAQVADTALSTNLTKFGQHPSIASEGKAIYYYTYTCITEPPVDVNRGEGGSATQLLRWSLRKERADTQLLTRT